MAKTRSADRQRHGREAIERQQASVRGIVGVCTKAGLSPASFHAWKRRLRRPRHEAGRKAVEALLPVQIVDAATTGMAHLEVHWPSGVVLRLRGCDVQTVGVVIATLSGRPTRRERRC